MQRELTNANEITKENKNNQSKRIKGKNSSQKMEQRKKEVNYNKE